MTLPRTATRRAAMAACALALSATACGGMGTEGRACGPTIREALDPAYLVHVVGDGAGVTYSSDPPTSGPHQPAPAVGGMTPEPLAGPVQVGVLERGDILIQYRPNLQDDDLDELAALADERVVVAPNSDLATAIVATAWTAKRSCDSLDIPSLEGFIRERAGKGPES
ncbi:MAG: DUF3105 domain-containing protein [Acidimicrobiales bacterium]